MVVLVLDNSCFDTERSEACTESPAAPDKSSCQGIMTVARGLGHAVARATTCQQVEACITQLTVTHVVSSGSDSRFSLRTVDAEVLRMNATVLRMLPSTPFLGICFG
jgi:hypothetical protein